ncbi:regulatory protein RecX [Angustibacter sp. Root456]|uniref:regulatory protein RecX n=1 Tax=Angustibacter sp. Root456 TaxID=1736539 RepID=UPI000A584550|nr:regulatory protein RecX [Angustibacter sp. Root456]
MSLNARRPAGRGTSRPVGPREPVPGGAADETPDADPESVARSIVLRQLTMAPRSRAQLAEKLAERGADEAVAERVLDRFEEVGLVDDTAFAEGWVRSRQATRGLSRRALAHELRSKGIDDELARATLDQVDDESEVELARGLVARRLASVRGLPPEKQVNRLVGMLARKGYSSGLAFRVVREALADADQVD